MASSRNWLGILGRAAAFAAATGIPLIVFLRNFSREVDVALRFALHELSALVDWAVPGVALVLLTLLLLLVFGWKFIPGIESTARQLLFALRQRSWPLSVGLGIGTVVLILLAGRAEAIRFRLYSESYFPERALEQLSGGDFRPALTTCRRYVDLFPQRAPDGSVPDRVCTPLLELSRGMADLVRYIEARRVDTRIDRRMTVPAAWEARRRALELAADWAGFAEPPAADPEETQGP